MRVLAAAICLTAIWAALDRVIDPWLGLPPTDLMTAFFAALGGAAMIGLADRKREGDDDAN